MPSVHKEAPPKRGFIIPESYDDSGALWAWAYSQVQADGAVVLSELM